MQKNISSLFYLQAKLMLFIVACDAASTEANKVIVLCNDFQEVLPLPSAVRSEALTLIKTVEDNAIAFTAANFFSINRVTFFNILSIMTTYVIVIIQFNA